jgi:hypothetical protein
MGQRKNDVNQPGMRNKIQQKTNKEKETKYKKTKYKEINRRGAVTSERSRLTWLPLRQLEPWRQLEPPWNASSILP